MAIGAQVTRLLAHYWAANESPESREAQMADWIDDLRQYGSLIVSEACKSWRRTETKRPTPADIRKLCERELHEYTYHGRIAAEANRLRDARNDWDDPYRKPTDEDRAYVDDRAKQALSILKAAMPEPAEKRKFEPTPEQLAEGRRALGID